MSTKTLKSLDPRPNFSIIVPIDGEIEVKDSQAEVSAACAEQLLTIPSLWADPSAKPAKVGKGAAAAKKAENQDAKSTSEATSNDSANTGNPNVPSLSPEDLANLDNLDLAGLVEIAEAADPKGWKMFKSKEGALRTFLKNRLGSK